MRFLRARLQLREELNRTMDNFERRVVTPTPTGAGGLIPKLRENDGIAKPPPPTRTT